MKVAERFAPLLSLSLLCGMVALYIAAGSANAEPLGGAAFSIKNPIDKFIKAALDEQKVQPSPLSTDEEFLRRAYLDLCGVIPPGDTVHAFISDTNPNKRAKAIDSLLNSKRYAEHWATQWCDMLREQTNAKNGQGTIRGSYRTWIEETFEKNMPYDQFARSLLTATGGANDTGAVNFYLRDAKGNNIDTVETVNLVAGVFMGTRMACAQCHDHPFDKWQQTDFHSLMAYFNRTRTVPDMVDTLLRIEKDEKNLPKDLAEILAPHIAKAKELAASPEKKAMMTASLGATKGKGGDMMSMDAMMDAQMSMFGKNLNLRKEIDAKLPKEEQQRANNIIRNHEIRNIVEAPAGEYHMPTDGDGADKKKKSGGEVVKPTFPWNPALETPTNITRRAALADQLVSTPQFASVQVNRIWSQLLGKGIVDPIDDFRPKNAPSHPEMLEYLTQEFVKSKFDNKHIIRLIMNSSTYQLSSAPTTQNRADKQLFSHQNLKRLTAEQVFDSILVATGKTQGVDDPKEIGTMNMGKRKNYRANDAKGIQWAADLPTPSRPGNFMNTFNQPQRDQSVFERETSGSIPQSLEMMNGGTVATAVRNSPIIAGLVKDKASAKEAVEELYLWSLSRMPSSSELSTASRFIGEAPTRDTLEDLQWALLNAREFMFVK